MKILHVLPSIDPKLGGVVECVRHIAAASLAAGVPTEILTVEAPSVGWLSNWRVPVHWVGNAHGFYRFSWGLVSWLRRNHSDYDAVIVHGVWQYHAAGVWLALRGTATPYFLVTHGMLNPWFREAYPFKHVKKAVYWWLIEHRVMRDARHVLFTSEAERASASVSFRPYRCHEKVIGMGTAPPPQDAAAQLDRFLRVFPHLIGKRVVLFLGRIHRVKGCDMLVDAFGRVAANDDHLHLVIAGSDEERLRPELERIVSRYVTSDRVTWTGHLDDTLKWGALRAAAVFALPSHAESYGNALIEAMACGVPALITDKVNTWQEIIADDAGLVASDSLDGVIGLLHDWSLLGEGRQRELGANALRCYRTRFELQGFMRRFVDFLGTTIAETSQVRPNVKCLTQAAG
jgi:glycosyltransferase involved in cell wall biosynthesis